MTGVTTQAVLMNPGPIILSQRVRKALTQVDLCHREPEFSALQDTVRGRLLDLYKLPHHEYAAGLLSGSGTAALEAMLCSLIPTHSKVLIPTNGVYGERLCRIAEIHGIRHDALIHGWDESLHSGRISDILDADPQLQYIAVVHHETTTGRLNALAPLAELCQRKGRHLLVDAVSSFGAEDIDFAHRSLMAVAASANKCLHGIPGLSFVVLRREALQARQDIAPRSLYLNLHTYVEEQDRGGTPFTPSVQCCYALAEALQECREQGGWHGRQKCYRQRMEYVRKGLTDMGVRPLLDSEYCASALNAFQLPEGLSYTTLHDALKSAGYVIYAGQRHLAEEIFRVACMGEIKQNMLHGFLTTMREILTTHTGLRSRK